MAEPFNAYYEWLGIPPEVERPDHYQLLGLRTFEDNPRVIENAADRQMSHLRTFQSGRHAADSQRILNEVAAAKLCLLKPEKRAAYEARMRALLEARKPAQLAPSQDAGANVVVPVQPVQPAAAQPTAFRRVVATPVNPVQVVRTTPAPTQQIESFVPDVTGGDFDSGLGDRSSAARGESGRHRANRGKKPGIQAPVMYGLVVLVSATVGLVGMLWMRANRSQTPLAEADPAGTKPAAEAKQAPGEHASGSTAAKAKGGKARHAPTPAPGNRGADSDAVATILSAASGETIKPEPAALPAANRSQPTSPAMTPSAVPATGGKATQFVAGEPVDLLALIDPARDAVRGQWTMTGGVLNSPATEYPILEIPYAPPANYTLQVVGEREAGEGLTLGLILAGKQAHAVFDANNRTLSGIGNIDGKGPSNNPTGNRINDVLGNRQRYTVVCAVRGCGVEVSVNGKSIAKWSGTPDQLSLAWGGGPHKDRLFIQQHKGVHHISAITLVPYALPSAVAAKDAPASPAVAKSEPAMVASPPAAQPTPGSVVYLSELSPLDSATYPNLKPKVGSGGVPSPHGIFLHPPDGKRGFKTFKIGGNFSTFDGRVSLNDSVPNAEGLLTFSVLGDGKELWRSNPVKTSADEQAFNINVQGVDRLELVVTYEHSLRRAHGAWIEPRLIGKEGAAAAMASSMVASTVPAPVPSLSPAPPPAGVVTEADEPITTFNDPAFKQWVRRVASLPAEEQVSAVAEKLQELNPGFERNKLKPRIDNGVVTHLLIEDKHVRDLSPLRALPRLTQLIYLDGKSLSDLSPLKGMSLTSLSCSWAHLSDLTPLRGMPLTFLNIGESKKISDLSPLKGMKLTVLNINGTAVSDLTPLKGMPLADLTCTGTQISDLSPLATCNNLKRVNASGSRVTAASVAALQKARPKCKIESNGAGK